MRRVVAFVVRVKLVIENWRAGGGDPEHRLNVAPRRNRHLDLRGHVMDRANVGPAAARSPEVKIPPAIHRDRVRWHPGVVFDVPRALSKTGPEDGGEGSPQIAIVSAAPTGKMWIIFIAPHPRSSI